MTDLSLLHLVPIGEENAATARTIWQVYDDGWALTTVKAKLNIMAHDGLIERKQVQSGAGNISLFYRRNGQR